MWTLSETIVKADILEPFSITAVGLMVANGEMRETNLPPLFSMISEYFFL